MDDLTEYRKKKRGDSVAKHARNKTVTEGIAFDIDALNGKAYMGSIIETIYFHIMGLNLDYMVKPGM